MANENVKIVVLEDNQTQPMGNGASSDIVYVPGLAVDHWHDGATTRTPVKNIPVLCTTVEEFENAFGPYPYLYTDLDITNNPYIVAGSEGSYVVDGPDKSYMYARELLNAGLSVLYENIASEEGLLKVGHASYSGNLPNVTDNKNCTFSLALDKCVLDKDNQLTETKTKLEFLVNLNYRKPLAGTSVTIDIKVPNIEGLSVASSKLEIASATNTKAFSIENVADDLTKKIINIVDARSVDFEYTSFKLSVELTYKSEKSVNALIEMDVLEGNTVSVASDISTVSPKVQHFYEHLIENLHELEDKNEYSVKYITSGGYPTFILVSQDSGSDPTYSLADAMLSVAEKRGDAVALIDHPDVSDKALKYNDSDSFYYAVNEFFGSGDHGGEFGAMFSPWGTYNCVAETDPTKMAQFMPASFGYLMCLASAIKTSPNWLAMAGVTRGSVPNLVALHTNKILTNMIAEDYQPKYGKEGNKVSVNAITNIKPYGLTIWGNRTLEPVPSRGTIALNFLNTRNMVSDIKKLAYQTAKELMFEQDGDTLWLDFKSKVSPLLEQLKSGNGISDYKIIRSTTKYNKQPLTRGELAAVIKILPKYAIEYFEITVVMADDDVAVS